MRTISPGRPRPAPGSPRYETWWVVHLYLYLALVLAFAHQIAIGISFTGHPLVRVLWIVVWAATAGTVIVFRMLQPAWRSLRHQLVVTGVRYDAPGVVSVICRGRHLDKLAVSGGQFFLWRFLARDLWWQAHPYSLAALPSRPTRGFKRELVRTGHRFMIAGLCGLLSAIVGALLLVIEVFFGGFVAAIAGAALAAVFASLWAGPALWLRHHYPQANLQEQPPTAATAPSTAASGNRTTVPRLRGTWVSDETGRLTLHWQMIDPPDETPADQQGIRLAA